MQPFHGLLCQSSRELRAVDCDLRGTVGKNLAGTSRNLRKGEVERAGNVTYGVGVVRKYVHENERRVVQAPPQLFAGDLADIGRKGRVRRLG
jgi:hypothetical protein